MNVTYSADRLMTDQLFPFTQTRAVLDLRVGIFTLREKWALLGIRNSGGSDSSANELIEIPQNLIATKEVVGLFKTNQPAKALSIASRIVYPRDIYKQNDLAIRNDFELITHGRKSGVLPAGNQAVCPEHIFVEEGARVQFSLLNASTGPIYIGRNAEIMEGCMIRGPVAICEGATLKMGTKIYGATTIGPYSVAGGEIKNAVIFGYSNKGHEGYLGDAVIGEWCNLGAGTTNSNLKNSAANISVWDEGKKRYEDAGLKCGLMMGDYSRAAINTSFNTATVVGVSCNIFGAGLTPKFIPSFSWGYSNAVKYKFEKAIEAIARWKKMKNQDISDDEIRTLKHIFDHS